MSRENILLVEDEPVTALAEATKLQDLNFEVKILNSGQESIEYIDENDNIDLILMDIELEDRFDGIEAAHKIQNNHDIPVLYLTSHNEAEFLKKAEETTNYNYLLKNNCNDAMLENAIHQALKLHKAHQKIKKQNQYLSKKEEEYRKIVQAARDPIAIIKDSQLYLINKAFTNLTGYSREDLIKTPLNEIHSFKPIQKKLNHLKNTNESEVRLKFELLTLADSIRNISARIIQIRIHFELAYILILHDVTEQKRLLQKLKENKFKHQEKEELIPICAKCKSIRKESDEKEVWIEPEQYMKDNLPEIKFTHSICPDCIETMYPEFYKEISPNMDT